MSVPNKPVILLAFANEHDQSTRFLRNLAEEARRLRTTLENAERDGLCEVVIRTDATINEILDVFQDKRYNNRIAIFHFGGHANGYQLLLETPDGKTTAANAGGLAAFLGQQDGLEMVFLNGCSTQPQAQGLLDAQVSVVIATAQAIDDAVATDFASRFYQGLAGGATIETAYHEAAGAVRTARDSDLRHLYALPADESALLGDRFPWLLVQRPGAEIAAQWNLPLAVDDPLFGLPPLPVMDLPDSPYRQLNWYTREHAEVFCGRGQEIRNLYQSVTAAGTAPIILFYGQSGVGKSSLLAAGLLPRLERDYKICYLRRDQNKGLWGTLTSAPSPLMDTGQAWLAVEKEAGKPLVIVLDQVEELYTRSTAESAKELTTFLEALHSIFADPAQRPRGRLILSFRKEWLAEIEEQLTVQKLPRTKIFLERLTRQGIIEAILGPTDSARLRAHYHLTVDATLPSVIADDLRADTDSPIATTLQILLSKLWVAATEQNRNKPHFTQQLYQRLKREGILLGDFLDQQLKKLGEWRAESVESGLALDLLAFHTTALGTAAQRRMDEVRSLYPHCPYLNELIQQNKALYLLTDSAADQPETQETATTRLAHDTLAPLVRQRFDASVAPGQRARRVLESRAVDWQQGKVGAPLDERDLSVIEAGQTGMRAWDADSEIRLIKASQAARAERQRQAQLRLAEQERVAREQEAARQERERLVFSNNRRLRIFLAVAAGLLMIATVSAWRWYVAQGNEREQRELAEQQTQEALNQRDRAWRDESRRLATLALQQLAVDPVAAVHLSLLALPSPELNRPYVPEAEFALVQALHTSQERQYLSTTITSRLQLAIRPNQIAVGGATLRVLDDTLATMTNLAGYRSAILGVQWVKDGRLLAYDSDTVYLWQGETALAQHTFTPTQESLWSEGGTIKCAAWHPQRDEVALCADRSVVIWAPGTDHVRVITDTIDAPDFGIDAAQYGAAWSPDGRWLAAWGATLVLWDSQTAEHSLIAFDPPHHLPAFVTFAQWSADSKTLAYAWDQSTQVRRWSTEQERELAPIDAGSIVNGGRFITMTDDAPPQLLVWSEDGRASRWSIDGNQQVDYSATALGTGIQEITISPDNQFLLTLHTGGTVYVWQLADAKRYARLSEAVYSLHTAEWYGHYLATPSINGSVLVWNLSTPTDALAPSMVLRGYRNDERVLGVHWLDAQRLLTFSNGADQSPGSLRIWQLFDENHQPLCRFTSAKEPARCTFFSRSLLDPELKDQLQELRWVDDTTLVATGFEGVAQHWDVARGAVVTLPIAEQEKRRAVWNPAGDQVLTYHQGQEGQIWKLQGQVWQSVMAVAGPIDYAHWLAAGLLVSEGVTKTELIDPLTNHHLTLLDNVALEQVIQLTTTQLAVLDGLGNVHLWDIPSVQQLTLLVSEGVSQVIALDASPDGRYLLTVAKNGDAILHDLQSATQPWSQNLLKGGFSLDIVKVSPNLRHIAVLRDGSVYLTDIQTSQEPQRAKVDAYLFDLAWNKDGSRLLVWDDAQVYVLRLDVQSGVVAPIFMADKGHGNPMFNLTETQLATIAEDGHTLRIWRLWPDYNELIQEAQSCCAIRVLTEQQFTELGIEISAN